MLIELSIAVAIASIAMIALASLLFARQSYVLDAHLRSNALFAAVSNLETTRATAAEHFLSLKNSSNTEETLSTSTIISDLSPCLRSIDSSASWQPSAIKKTITFSVLIPFTAYAKAVDGDCEGTIFPEVLSATSSFQIHSTSIIGSSTAIDVLNNTISISSTSDGSSTLSLFQTQENSSAITKLSSITISGTVSRLDTTQNFVYLALLGTSSQFRTISIHDKHNPQLVAEVSLPGVTGSYPGATSIFYYNNKVYIGTHRTAGNEFHIFDVSSEKPVWLGSIELNHNINSISIREPYAFLATSGNTKDLIVLDISNPKAIKNIGSLALSGTEDALSEFLIGNTLYLGRKKSLKSTEPDFVMVDISNPTQPRVSGSLVVEKTVSQINIAGNYAFLATENARNSLDILNISDPKNIQRITTISIPQVIQGLDVENDSAFVASDNQLFSLNFEH